MIIQRTKEDSQKVNRCEFMSKGIEGHRSSGDTLEKQELNVNKRQSTIKIDEQTLANTAERSISINWKEAVETDQTILPSVCVCELQGKSCREKHGSRTIIHPVFVLVPRSSGLFPGPPHKRNQSRSIDFLVQINSAVHLRKDLEFFFRTLASK
jgi:hypothetical protein